MRCSWRSTASDERFSETSVPRWTAAEWRGRTQDTLHTCSTHTHLASQLTTHTQCSKPYTHASKHVHTLSSKRTHSNTLSLYLSHTQRHTHSLFRSLSHTHAHTHTCTLTHAQIHSHTHCSLRSCRSGVCGSAARCSLRCSPSETSIDGGQRTDRSPHEVTHSTANCSHTNKSFAVAGQQSSKQTL